MARHEGRVKKGWGEEVIFATNDQYCGKLLKFNEGAKFSMHFHKEKHESWYVLEGEFILKKINTQTAEGEAQNLRKGHTVIQSQESTASNQVLAPALHWDRNNACWSNAN